MDLVVGLGVLFGLPIDGPSQGLAVDGDDVVDRGPGQARDVGRKRLPELLGVDGLKNAPEGVMGWDASRQGHILLDEPSPDLGELLNLDKTIGAAQGSDDDDKEDGFERMHPVRRPGVLNNKKGREG